MANCKEDCLHYNVCYKKPIHAVDTDLDIMGGCSDFKNKADFQEVKHGYNIQADTPSLFRCSVCDWSDNDTYTGDTATYNYCPNCGAKMDGGKNE